MPLVSSAAKQRPRIAIVSRELYPFGGGGMGNYVAWTASALADVAEVTVITTDRHEEAYRELLAAGDPRVDPRLHFRFGADFEFRDQRTFYGYFHRWSATVHELLREAYPERGPDLIEFADYHGEGAVTLQARRTSDPWLAGTRVCVRLNSSSEMVLVLDGHLDDEPTMRRMYELERYSLRYADRIIHPGGDVLGAYERYYGADAIAPAVRIPHVVGQRSAAPLAPRGTGSPKRLLYMGRLERRKGLTALVAALRSLERDDWRLTILGGDTGTGPLGVSVRGQLEIAVAGDERIEFAESVRRERVLEVVDEHEVVVVPSLWECWPNVALEAFERGRPVLGTPVGGLAEMVVPGRSGLLAEGTDRAELATALERVLDGELDQIPLEAPREVFEELTDPEPIRKSYLDLIPRTGSDPLTSNAGGDATAPGGSDPATASLRKPTVTTIIPYYHLSNYITAAVESLAAQTYPELQIVVVNDGSFEPADEVLERLAERHPIEVVAQPNSGLSAARNLGVSLALGDYVLPFDADNVAGPRLVERLVTALEGDAALAYATSWSDFIDERGRPWREDENGYQPLGNWSRLLAEENVAGDATALIRREVFDSGIRYDPELTSYEDWHFYRRLWDEGLVGHVVPERLYSYRVRQGSMLRTVGLDRLERQRAELAAHLAESRVEWTAAR